VGVVDKAVHDGVGVSRITDDFVPSVDRQLGRDHGGVASVAFFEDFQEIVSGDSVEWLQAPIIE
jgi:hypothetical protein